MADHYGTSKTAVVNKAVKEGWQDRIADLEAKARERLDQKAVESLEAMNERHLKSLRVIQGKALETLRATSIGSAMDAVRALDMSIRGERLVRGEPSDRTAVSVEDVIKREFENWMVPSGDDGLLCEGDFDDHEKSTESSPE